MATQENSAACTGCGGLDTSIDPSAVPAGIARRTFLVQSALMAAAAALAACGADSSTSPSLSAGTTVNVNSYPALANVGGIAMVNAGGAALAIVRTGANSFVALSRVCPHQGTLVSQNGAGFLCPNHGARFDATGNWVGGQPTGNMHSYATSYDAATGTLTIS